MRQPAIDFRLKQQILTPVGIALFILLVAFGLVFKNYLAKHETRQTEISAQQTSAAWETLLADSQLRLAWFAQQTTGNPNLLKAMRRGDANALLAATQQQLPEMRQYFGISHWYFIKPDQKVLLRVHEPDRRGDPIERKTLTDASTSQQPRSGLELGPLGTYTLRYVIPWHDHGQLIGYIELGMEVEWFARQIEQLTHL